MRNKLTALLLSGLMILEPCSFVAAEDFTDGENSSIEELFSSDAENSSTQKIQNNDSYVGQSVETENESVVVNESESWSDKTINGDLFILQDCTLTIEGNLTVNGNVYVWGTLINNGYLTVTNTLNCLWAKYSGMIFSAGGNYSYGKVYFNSGGRFGKLNVTSNWLNTSIPDIGQNNPCKNGHTWDDGQIQLNATCTTNGYKIYTCTICGETKQEMIAAFGHSWNSFYTIDKNATCEQTGSQSIHCSICDTIKPGSEQEIPCTDHSWFPYSPVFPTCTREGIQMYYCIYCNKEKSEPIPATGHAWDNGYVTREATCTTTGEKLFTCNNCGETYVETLSKTGHVWNSEYTIDKVSTCTEKGQKSIHCSICDEIKPNSEQILPFESHKEVKDAAVTATCENTGKTEGSHCSVCGKVIKEQKEVPALGHNWDSGEISKAATCTETGVKTYTCTVCGKTKTETIAKTTEHKFGKWTKVSDATVFAKQKQKRICSICGKTEKRDYGNKLKATIKLNNTSITLQQKQTTKSVKVTMAKGDSVKSWTSNNKKVATVDKNGIIKAQKKNGTAKITVTLKSGKKATVTVKVQSKKITTSKITGLKSKVTLKKGQKLILKPVISPVTSQDKITYATSDKSVATISSKGIITAKAKGTAVITVKSGKKLVRCKVTVK